MKEEIMGAESFNFASKLFAKYWIFSTEFCIFGKKSDREKIC